MQATARKGGRANARKHGQDGQNSAYPMMVLIQPQCCEILSIPLVISGQYEGDVQPMVHEIVPISTSLPAVNGRACTALSVSTLYI